MEFSIKYEDGKPPLVYKDKNQGNHPRRLRLTEYLPGSLVPTGNFVRRLQSATSDSKPLQSRLAREQRVFLDWSAPHPLNGTVPVKGAVASAGTPLASLHQTLGNQAVLRSLSP